MTRAREAALEILRNALEPLSAAAIFGMTGDRFDQATVYRTLHYLEDHGYADSFILHCDEHGTERYYTARSDSGDDLSHRHWFHCEQCHRFTDLGCCRLKDLVAGYEAEHDIKVRSHTLYLTGICASCRKKKD